MDLNSIKDGFDRVTKKQKLSSSGSKEMIEQIEGEIQQALSRIQRVQEPDHKFILNELKAKSKHISPIKQLETTQKELNITLNKYPKLLEKSFIPDISKAYRNLDSDTSTLNQIIASHFYREGQFDIGDSFLNDSNEPEASTNKSHFLQMFGILESMRSRNVKPALDWASANHNQLQKNNSDIELKLHRVQFIETLHKDGRNEALKYARANFPSFADKHMEEIQKLMACLLWAGKLESSPYKDLLPSFVEVEKLSEEVTREFCNLLGESIESPLGVTVGAGVQGLPTLLKLMNVMSGRKKEWETMKQLPVPVDLDREFQFHSVFVCPVSREQGSEENPPMLLPCGHVLCRQSIVKLSKNNVTRPFKCPYCPVEVEAGQCRVLHL